MPYKNKDKQREYCRIWVAKRRHNYFKDKVCVQCGSNYRLELDHIDPITKITHVIWSFSESKRNSELEKCQVLCRICHKIKTAKQLYRPLTHGNSGYDRKCRCIVCKDAHSLRMKIYKNKKAGIV